MGRYEGPRDRDYFHIMLNLDSHDGFLPTARRLAEGFGLADDVTRYEAQRGWTRRTRADVVESLLQRPSSTIRSATAQAGRAA